MLMVQVNTLTPMLGSKLVSSQTFVYGGSDPGPRNHSSAVRVASFRVERT